MRAYNTAVQTNKVDKAEQLRAKGFIASMQRVAADASPDLDDHPLIAELCRRFRIGPVAGTREGTSGGTSGVTSGGTSEGKSESKLTSGGTQWTFDLFYPEFLEPHTHDMEVARRLFGALDTDGSGEISSAELISACKWALREFGEDSGKAGGGGGGGGRGGDGYGGTGEVVIDSLDALIKTVVEEWLVPEALINELCVVPGDAIADEGEGGGGDGGDGGGDGDGGRNARSEAAPATEAGPGEVRVMVGTTVKRVVECETLRSKNVLITFYDPHCPHCIKMLPHLDALAAALADDAEVVIAKMDVIANAVPKPFEVPTTPTIYFKKANGFHVQYQGLRETKPMLDFIRKQRA